MEMKEYIKHTADSKKYGTKYIAQFTSRLLMARSCCLMSSCSIAGLRAISMVCKAIHSSQVSTTTTIASMAIKHVNSHQTISTYSTELTLD